MDDQVARITDVGSLTRAELRERGRAERKRLPRRAHAEWSAPADRRDPLDVLRESNATRIPELVPIRYGRMLASPFGFLRGAPAVMTGDLARTGATGIHPQICGDAHLSNFGLFGTPERGLIFDLNDFDETLPGPFEWDLKRLVASFVVAARAYGFGEAVGRAAAHDATARYAATTAALARASTLDIWYARVDSRDLMGMVKGAALRRRLDRSFRKARRRDSVEAYSKLAAVVDGRHVIRDDPPLIVHPEAVATEEPILQFWEQYTSTVTADRRHLLEQYRVVDVARKVVGVGSVGTHCYVALLVGRGDRDVLFLQVKQALPSVFEPYLGRSEFANHAERVVTGQRLMQAASDLFLGWGTSVYERDLFVRQLRDMKMSADIATLSPDAFRQYAVLCGHTLARAHANTCDPALIAGYVGTGDVFASALVEFAVAYADQTEADHARLVDAVRAGEIEAVVETG